MDAPGTYTTMVRDPELGEGDEFGGYPKPFAILQVTVRPHDQRPLSILALSLSFIPWVVPLILLIDIFATQRFYSVYAIIIAVLCAVVNEGILKRIFNQPRPETSEVRYEDRTLTPGMPSGHVLNSQTLTVWAILEVVASFSGAGDACCLVVLGALMVGVPWSRWYIGDHTWNQVLVALVLGTVFGVTAFVVDMEYLQDYHRPASTGPGQPGGGFPHL